MTTESNQEKLQRLQLLSETAVKNISKLENSLAAEHLSLKQCVQAYNELLVDHFYNMLNQRGLTWCTGCEKIINDYKGQILFIESNHRFSCGYEGGDYAYEYVARLQRLCKECADASLARHGWKGEYDTALKQQAYFYAYRAEFEGDRYYADKFGDRVEVPEKFSELKKLSDTALEKLLAEYTGYKRLEYANNSAIGGMLLIGGLVCAT